MVISNVDNFLFAGCSHTSGSEIFYPKKVGAIDDEKKAAFGAHVSKAMNKKYYNLAFPGIGNQFIARSVLFWLLHNKDKVNSTFVVIHWTSEHRLDYSYTVHANDSFAVSRFTEDNCYDKNQVCIMSSSLSGKFPYRVGRTIKHLQKAIALDSMDRTWQQIDKFTTILWMQELLKSWNVPYLFFNSHDHLENTDRYKLYVDEIDTSKFIDPYIVGKGFYERVLNAGFESNAEFMHHQEPGHQWYAKWLLENYFI
jgi:hypothetical protein